MGMSEWPCHRHWLTVPHPLEMATAAVPILLTRWDDSITAMVWRSRCISCCRASECQTTGGDSESLWTTTWMVQVAGQCANTSEQTTPTMLQQWLATSHRRHCIACSLPSTWQHAHAACAPSSTTACIMMVTRWLTALAAPAACVKGTEGKVRHETRMGD